ncbi:MAG: C4-dicarboxylate ABC transporter substrate-binding protein [Nitrospinaceae bacterium]|nr:C4-dicarboxylate ABC transporter substrate-binding protein [Nitrospinaceae bacterium]
MCALAPAALAGVLSFFVGCGDSTTGQADKQGVVKARFASEEIEGDYMTVWGKRFADHMSEQTQGNVDITVYPYGSLGDTRDINELAQLGVVEFVFSDFAWISSFVPEAQVLALHYVWPRQQTAEVLDWVVNHGAFMPMLEEAFREKNLVPLAIMFEGWQWITSKSPANDMEAIRGIKTRLMGSKILVEQYRTYGMSPTPMSYGEVYSALQTGLIDAQVNPLFANYSMKFYEVTDHFTQMWAEPFLGIPAVNAKFFDSLDSEVQEEMKRYFRSNIVSSGEWINERNAADRKKIESARPDVTWTEWSDSDMAKAREQAMTIRNTTYPELTGARAEILLQALLKDIESAKQAITPAPAEE